MTSKSHHIGHHPPLLARVGGRARGAASTAVQVGVAVPLPRLPPAPLFLRQRHPARQGHRPGGIQLVSALQPIILPHPVCAVGMYCAYGTGGSVVCPRYLTGGVWVCVCVGTAATRTRAAVSATLVTCSSATPTSWSLCRERGRAPGVLCLLCLLCCACCACCAVLCCAVPWALCCARCAMHAVRPYAQEVPTAAPQEISP
jgi:hypothetical protein